MIMAPRNESPLSQKANPYSFDLSRPILSLKNPFCCKPLINSTAKYIPWYMSYLRELIEHGIMLVSCNKDILRLSVGGVHWVTDSFILDSFHLFIWFPSISFHSIHQKSGKFKIKYNGDSKSSKIKVIKLYLPLSSCIYIYKNKK